MKIRTKILLSLLLISALAILLVGCVLPDSSPGYTPGSITGIIMIPSQCADCLVDGPCLPKSNGDIPTHWVPAEEAIVTVIPHATLTDEDGYYTLTDVEPGVYYVITATIGNLVLKDVVLPDGVEAGKTYDAGTANCESTALGLVVEYLMDSGLTTEDIGPALDMYTQDSKFGQLVDTVCCIIEDCENVTTYCNLIDEPEFTPELEFITVNAGSMNLCLDDSESVPSVSVVAHYTDGGSSKTVTSSASITYTSNDPSIASLIGKTVTGNALGSTTIDVSATYKEGDITVSATDIISVNVIDCTSCIPELESITVLLGDTKPMTICDGVTTSISSEYIASIIAHYTCDAPDVTLPLSTCNYESENSSIASVAGLDVTGNSVGKTNIVVSYTDDGITVVATQKVAVEVEDCTPTCISAYLESFSLEIKEGSGWTEYLGGFDSDTTVYNVITTNFAEHFRFTVDAECAGDAKLYYNWYRGISCTNDWLTGETGYSDLPPSWIPITSGGTYPTAQADRPVCNKGGNVLFVKVENNGISEIYKVYVDRP